MLFDSLTVTKVPTTPYEGQKMGTSGLRKRVKEFQKPNYLANFIEATLNVAEKTEGTAALVGGTLVVGGDGRYWNDEAIGIILRAAFAHGVKRVVTGQFGLLSTPEVSLLVRKIKAAGAFILTASHNPGGPDQDFGIKFNMHHGASAPERVTDQIYVETTTISSLTVLKEDVKIDLKTIGITQVSPGVQVQVISPVADYVALMAQVFDFSSIGPLLRREGFSIDVDGMHGVSGPYAHAIFHDVFGLPLKVLHRCNPLPDFGGGHPDPNLVHAHELVERMRSPAGANIGAAFDGDADRNMIVGGQPYTFVTPSDSLAIIAHYCTEAIPWFKERGLAGAARSMPSSGALDHVCEARGVSVYQVPTGWKFFCDLLDTGKINLCGEESFGTGSDHIREKDGVWALLAWLSILAHVSPPAPAPVVSVAEVQRRFWEQYGRCLYVRYDYEECETAGVKALMAELDAATSSLAGKDLGDGYVVKDADNFSYEDIIEHTVSAKQGIRVHFTNRSRIVYRQSGTAGAGATLRIYLEVYAPKGDPRLFADAMEVVKPLGAVALRLAKVEEHTKRTSPSVIT